MSSQSILSDIEQSKIARMNAMERLLNNEDYKLVVMDYFLKESVIELMYREGISDSNIHILNARKIFSDKMYDIIEEGRFAIAKKENK